MTSQVSGKRTAKAFAITLALVLCVPATGAVVDAGSAWGQKADAPAQDGKPSGGAGIDAATLIGQGDMQGFLARLEDTARTSDPALPPAFEHEVALPARYRDLRVSEDGKVIGCVVDLSAEAVARDVDARMAAGGWLGVPLGSLKGSTYVKADGECAWVLVTCTQVGNAANVVYRCVFR